jgi:hypothetical protein
MSNCKSERVPKKAATGMLVIPVKMSKALAKSKAPAKKRVKKK